MKKIGLFLLLVCFTSSLVRAQSPEQHLLQPRSSADFPLPSPVIQNQVPVEIPGKGLMMPGEIVVKQLYPDNRRVKQTQIGHAQHSQVPQPEITRLSNGEVHFNHFQDERQLPLSPSGKLLSVDGFEVDFEIPYNPNDPGGNCATPIPVIKSGSARAMANCPPDVACDLAANRDANIPQASDPIKFMQLRWVVVQTSTGGASSNINQARIDQLMAEVNADFLPFRIQFCADPATFVVDDAFDTLNVITEDALLKNTYGATPNQVINCYVVRSIRNPSAGGYARFPYDPLGGLNIRGGVVLARNNMFVGTHTLAHELGHTFGLHHTFHGVDEVPPCTNCYEGRDLGTGASSGADTEGDWCSDTNPHQTNANICGDAGTDGCAPNLPWLNSPVNNHMSYSFCTTQFTPQQAGRMHCMIDTYLQNWVNNGGAICGSQPPVADFVGTPTIWQSPHTVSYTDLSVPTVGITNWDWNFDVTGIGGVTPATFNGPTPPNVVYTLCDTTYTVSLTVSNANGSDTETKVDYITTQCPAAACDTLDGQWETPPPLPSISAVAAGDYLTGVPAPTLGGGTIGPIGYYERYITPSPGSTDVGAIRVALGEYSDPDSNMTIDVLIYNSDAVGVPVGAPIGGVVNVNPGADLGVPGPGAFAEIWIPITKTVVDSPSFLVGVDMFPGNATDSLVLISSSRLANQGQGAGLNFWFSPFTGYFNYLATFGVDFDLHIIPMLGPFEARPFITGLFQGTVCDTTLVLITDTVLNPECITSMTVTSNTLGVVQDTNVANLDSIFILYTTPPPDTFTFETINECGRTDSFSFFINYAFDTTPVPDFTVSALNPICAGTQVTFTATPPGMIDYTWDFGDGTVVSSGFSQVVNHTYATPGLYYVSLTVTDVSGCPGEETKLDFIEVIDCSVNAPIAGFDFTPDTACVGDLVTFTDTSQAVPDAATDWLWEFDDGTFSIQQNPTHTYLNPGTYNVTLISGNSGGADTITIPVVVLSLPCILSTQIELQASPVGSSVVLGWTVPEDLVDADYEVFRSLDGVDYTSIGNVTADQATGPQLFGFIDDTPLQGQELFYRVQGVNQNGESQFSNVASVRLDGDRDQWLNIYPNPLSEGEELNVDAFLLEDAEVRIQVYDALGRQVLELNRELNSGLGRTTLNTTQLSRGSYLIRVSSQGRNTVKKVLVK